jgi:hypothetical protein
MAPDSITRFYFAVASLWAARYSNPRRWRAMAAPTGPNKRWYQTKESPSTVYFLIKNMAMKKRPGDPLFGFVL